MTNAKAAAVFERAITDRRAKGRFARRAVRYKQMERIAARLREHPDDERFGDEDGMEATLYDLGALDLLLLEVTMNDWYGWPVKT